MVKQNAHQRIKILLVLVIILISGTIRLNAQTYLYFQDSPANDLWDYSWMELTAPSELERLGGELRKFPVESVLPAHQGVNSLRLKWTSKAGGNWFAIAAGTGWTEKNISTADTLMFWLYSVEGISAADLPKVFMEDITNKKSNFQLLTPWIGDLAPGVWSRVAIPMSIFFDAADGTDYTKIKTIGFTQNTTDGVQHTLLIDDMRVFKGDGTFPPASQPSNPVATGYEYHIEVSWDPNPETTLNGYEIERSLDGGSTYKTIKVTDKSDNVFVDWVKSLGTAVTASYRVKALNENNDPSLPSETVTATTRSLSDDELLDMVERYTFRYFWDYAEPNSGMNRDRNYPVDMVTSGGSGFGVMAILVGIERGYITREQGIERILKILNFLETADRFHGAWSHFINGKTGKVIPFSTKDNGGDLVETAFMIQGLLTVRQYFDGTTTDEQAIVSKITALWEAVEWDWYRQNNQNVIYWHWSPNYEWQMNMQVRGWNEAAIVYLLAIASPTHPVPASLWKTGWAGTTYYKNGKTFYGNKLWVGWDYGGPLFFAHYSFLGFDPRNIADSYANYFDNNRSVALIHQAYAIQNPKNYTGYNEGCWGMTASDDPDGYTVHEPTSGRDNGTISPTAALASFPYTPEESMLALKHFYRELGDKTWNWMGFYDAFNEKRNWWATSYLAIDQGPIILMIENYRTQLLWNLFMTNPEIQPMMDAIGFNAAPNKVSTETVNEINRVYPNPVDTRGVLSFELKQQGIVTFEIFAVNGTRVASAYSGDNLPAGKHSFALSGYNLIPGIYISRLSTEGNAPEMIKLVVK
jgi:hypothetical protein